jgi:selT/selW/selH-like putative selenoprotein
VAAEVKKISGADVQIVPGKNGIFEVKRDGKVIYSKEETGRFPKPGEVTALLSKA